MSKDQSRANEANGAEAASRDLGDHIDENTLAMIEVLDVITQSEREHIVAHIMDCAACRQLVSEALAHAPIPVPAWGRSILTFVRQASPAVDIGRRRSGVPDDRGRLHLSLSSPSPVPWNCPRPFTSGPTA